MGKLPILGVCLGHQSIGQATGGVIVRAKRLMHGKTDTIYHDGQRGICWPAKPANGNAITASSSGLTLHPDLIVSAWADAPDGDKEIMAVRSHKSLPLFGVQFHPESFLTEHGHDMLRNFLKC
ncbi:MAG: hypothetical protein U0894_12515 [Pirellulales bacterium]